MAALRRILLVLWVLPTTAPGLLITGLALLTGGGVQFVDGVLESHGGAAAWLLRYATLLRHGARAMTLGHVVLGLDPATLALTRAHERVHVQQAERWGPLFIPAYLIASAITAARGGRAYRDNPFEREAFNHSDPA